MQRAGATTVRGLLQRHELQLRLTLDEGELAPGALDRSVRWVHSSDLADPTPFISEDLVLLTTGTQFATITDTEVFTEYVARLSAKGVCALGFGTEVVREGIPTLLVGACRARGMPLFEVPYRIPFLAIARAHAEAIARQAYARRNWALAAQRAIALAALRPDGLSAILAELARQLDAWVGLFDQTGLLTREHPVNALDAVTASALANEVAALLRRGVTVGSSLPIGSTPFTLQTVGRGGHLLGVIAISAGGLDQESRGIVTLVIAMAGLAIEQNEGFAGARARLRAGVVASLHGDDPTLARRIAREMWGGLPSEPVVVAVTETSSRCDGLTEWLELRAHERRGRLFFGQESEGLLLVVPAGDADELAGLSDQLGTRIGVSAPAAYSGFSAAIGQARLALTRGTGMVSHFADVAADGVLSMLDSDAGRVLAHAAIAPLLAHDEAEGTNLVETVRVWLDHDARFEAVAKALGIHRHTARARISQAQKLLGVDLGGFAARAELWAALRALE